MKCMGHNYPITHVIILGYDSGDSLKWFSLKIILK
jgi:hypothetical protein